MSTTFPPGLVYQGSGTITATQAAQSQQPIQAQFDYLEKALVTLREDVQQLEGRLQPVLNVGPTRAEDGCASNPQPQTSALTARLMHLHSLVSDIQMTINTIHTQLEV